jgi:hypothetical protein
MRDIFPGNVIPLNRIDPVARKVLEFDPWRLPNRAGGFTSIGAGNNYLADEFARVFLDDYNLRLDHPVQLEFQDLLFLDRQQIQTRPAAPLEHP